MQLEMGDVQTESLIPASMGGPANLQQFMAELAKVPRGGCLRLAVSRAVCCHAEDLVWSIDRYIGTHVH